MYLFCLLFTCICWFLGLFVCLVLFGVTCWFLGLVCVDAVICVCELRGCLLFLIRLLIVWVVLLFSLYLVYCFLCVWFVVSLRGLVVCLCGCFVFVLLFMFCLFVVAACFVCFELRCLVVCLFLGVVG